jgi:hypothetical protein
MDAWEEVTVELLGEGRTVTGLRRGATVLVARGEGVAEGDLLQIGGEVFCQVTSVQEIDHGGAPMSRLELYEMPADGDILS